MSEATKTPLMDLLRCIPADAILRWDSSTLPDCSHSAPVGRMAHEAADTLAAKEAEITRLRSLVEEAGKVVGRLVNECGAEFTVDGKWYNDGQLVSEEAYEAARSLLTKLKEG